jgi:hypothetical protein
MHVIAVRQMRLPVGNLWITLHNLT